MGVDNRDWPEVRFADLKEGRAVCAADDLLVRDAGPEQQEEIRRFRLRRHRDEALIDRDRNLRDGQVANRGSRRQ